jgi:hypothetical protein
MTCNIQSYKSVIREIRRAMSDESDLAMVYGLGVAFGLNLCPITCYCVRVPSILERLICPALVGARSSDPNKRRSVALANDLY